MPRRLSTFDVTKRFLIGVLALLAICVAPCLAQQETTSLLDLASARFGELTPNDRQFFLAVEQGRPYKSEKTFPPFASAADSALWDGVPKLQADRIAWLFQNSAARHQVTVNGVQLSGFQISGPLDLSNQTASFPLRLSYCHIPAGLKLFKSNLQELTLTRCQIGKINAHQLELEEACTLFYCAVVGDVDLSRSRVDELQLVGTTLGSGKPTRAALNLYHAKVAGSLSCSHSIVTGRINLDRAEVGRNLALTGARVVAKTPDQWAVSAVDARVGGHLLFDRGAAVYGGLRLDGVRAEGNFSAQGATLSCGAHSSRRVLSMTDAQVFGSVFLNQAATDETKVQTVSTAASSAPFKATGAVYLDNSQIGGDLDCRGGQFEPWRKQDPALSARGLKIGRDLFLANRFAAKGKLDFSTMNVGGVFWLRGLAKPLDPRWAVDLRFARCRVLADEQTSWPEGKQLRLDGFEYEWIDDDSPHDLAMRLAWIGSSDQAADSETPNDPTTIQPAVFQPSEQSLFRPQPYEQLAQVLQACGYDREARDVLVAKAARRAQTTPRFSLEWVWQNVLGWTIGYGYRPYRAVWIGLAIIALGALVFGFARRRGLIIESKLAEHVLGGSEKSVYVTHGYHRFNPLVFSLDVFLPFIDLKQLCYWLPTSPHVRNQSVQWSRQEIIASSGLRIYLWTQMLFGWALTTLLLAAATGLIKN